MLIRLLFAVFFLSLISSLSAYPSTRWSRLDRADSGELLTLTIGLKQSNTDKLSTTLLEVSDPRSNDYGKHLSQQQVNDLIRPALKTKRSVINWLKQSNINTNNIEWSLGGEWLSLTLTVQEAELLLNTRYHEYKHLETGHKIIRSEAVNLPESVKSHIDVIGPTTRFPRITKKMIKSQKSSASLTGHKHQRVKASAMPAADCDGGSTPACIRSLYQVGDAAATSGNSSAAVTGFLEQYINLKDLSTFFDKYDTNSSSRPQPTIIGPNDQSQPGDEASLDIQYVSALGHGSAITFWYTAGRSPKNPENEPFLVFVQALANKTMAPFVVSTSYGDDEDSVDYAYAVRLDQEFEKAGVRGISILFSSGDSGTGCNQGGDKFEPTLPATLPSVTAVGATGYNGKTESASYFSSGGFGNFFAQPSYQTKAVQNYLTKYASSLPKSSYYNATGRAFPDVAALGEDFPIVLDGQVEAVDGTSCSSPTLAGIIATLNDIRLAAGKGSLGFLNPLFYQHPEVFNDITKGTNPGCDGAGFPAEAGWDPVTGMGTPNYAAMAKLIASLP